MEQAHVGMGGSIRALLRTIRDSSREVMVAGLGKSGVETLFLLERLGVRCFATEKQSEDLFLRTSPLADSVRALMQRGFSVRWGLTEEVSSELLANVALVVSSPGIARSSPMLRQISSKGVPILGEIEFGLRLLGRPYLAVTGSNGKSTTASLLHHVLRSAGHRSDLCGNIGLPVVSLVQEVNLEREPESSDPLVVEISSYQLESAQALKPRVGIFLNLSENHLERHGTMDRYRQAKHSLFANQDASDFAVLNVDDSHVRLSVQELAERRQRGSNCPAVLGFGTTRLQTELAPEAPRHAVISYFPAQQQDSIQFSFREGGEERGEEDSEVESYDLHATPLLGLHSRYNIAAVICAARCFGVSAQQLQESLPRFSPLAHRLEPIAATRENRVVINDSKATTVSAVVAAVTAVMAHYQERRLVLLLGGQAKVGSWQPVAEVLKLYRDRFQALIFFGADGRKVQQEILRHAGSEFPSAIDETTLLSATARALALSTDHNVVMLSPGCASFDEFPNFEARGDAFKQYVLGT